MRFLVLATMLAWAFSVWAEVVALEVEAGEFDRVNAVATVALPAFKGRALGLKGRNGEQLALQVDAEGVGWFVVPKLAKGRSAFFELKAEGPVRKAGVFVDRRGKKYRFSFNGQRLMEYQAEAGALPREGIDKKFLRGGYAHPVFTPLGKMVTDDFPLKHTHHHGVWFPWTKTEFEGRKPDFWNAGAGTARVEFVKVDATWSGPVQAGLVARHRFVDLKAQPKPKVALEETWTLRVFSISGAGAKAAWFFDLVSTQSCAGKSPLILPQYRYGGLGLRGNAAWDHEEGNPALFLTANGVSDRRAGHATRANWCWMGGRVKGALAGLAVLGHPRNFRAPQPMRIHPSEPFFNFAPQQFGPMAIVPEKKYVSRYRFVVSDGAPNAPEIQQFWRDYAQPPVVRPIEK